jgi:exosortase/archaeosortase family protein
MNIPLSSPLRLFFLRLIIILVPSLVVVLILRQVQSLNSLIVDSKIIYLFYKAIMVCSKSLLGLLGFHTTLVFSTTLYKYPVYAIQIDNGNYVFMGISCLGILLMGAFAALIIAYPGKWKHKFWFIPAGFIIIQVLNVFRMSILTILFSYYHINVLKEYNVVGLVKINHHNLFNFILYILIFFMFTFYVNHYGAKKGDIKL